MVYKYFLQWKNIKPVSQATKHPPATAIPKACTDILLYLIIFPTVNPFVKVLS